MSYQQPYQPAPMQPPKKTHTFRNVVLGILVGGFLLLGGCVALVGVGLNEAAETYPTEAPTTETLPEGETYEEAEKRLAEEAERAASAQPTETTQPPKPAAQKWVKLVTLNGSADKSSKVITLTGGDVRLTYNFRGSESLLIGSVYLLEKGTDLMRDGGIPEVMVTERSKDSTLLYRDPGAYYVKVTAANTRYTVTVEELR